MKVGSSGVYDPQGEYGFDGDVALSMPCIIISGWSEGACCLNDCEQLKLKESAAYIMCHGAVIPAEGIDPVPRK